MTIKETLKKYHKIEIELLLAHVLRKPREFFYMYPETRLTRRQADRLTRITDRRLKGEPVAYILGYKDFYGLRFKVNRDLLIPRPETEWVVERVIARSQTTKQSYQGKRLPRPSDALRARNDTLKILDLGTGSGCIAVALAKVLFDKLVKEHLCQITASDISPAAIELAKQNAKVHRVKIKFIQSDLLKNIKQDFDIIIANLPYLAPIWKSASIKCEPKRALFTKEKGLMMIRRLLEQIASLKQKPKLIYLEFDPRQKSQLLPLIKKSLPGSKIKFYKDFNNLWRYVEIESG